MLKKDRAQHKCGVFKVLWETLQGKSPLSKYPLKEITTEVNFHRALYTSRIYVDYLWIHLILCLKGYHRILKIKFPRFSHMFFPCREFLFTIFPFPPDPWIPCIYYIYLFTLDNETLKVAINISTPNSTLGIECKELMTSVARMPPPA